MTSTRSPHRGFTRVHTIPTEEHRHGWSAPPVRPSTPAKGGVIAFTKTLAREVARDQIRVNCVSPGPTDTALFAAITGDRPKLRDALIQAVPFRRLAEPTDLANAVAFLASAEAVYITGQTLSVSGGLTMV